MDPLRLPGGMRVLVVSTCTLALSGGARAGADPTLVDIALDLGFQDRFGHGRAQAAADFDGNGWTDFFIGNPSRPGLGNDDSFILWNRGPDGEGEFRFEKGPVLVKGRPAFGASAADYDNDGDPDLFIAAGGQEAVGLDYLFRNEGDGTFTDVSWEAGVRGPRDGEGRWIMTASLAGHWADYDRDGDVDLFVPSIIVGREPPRPDGLDYRDSLFRNEGDGTFTDVSVASGLAGGISTKTAAWGDYDNDGWVDIFVPQEEKAPFSAHDLRLFRNNRDGTFVEVALDENALGIGKRTWASANADFNNDGLLDIIVFARGRRGDADSHALLLNRGNWTFVNAAIPSGLAPPGVPAPEVMGCQIGDLNNDGLPDLIMANGGPIRGKRDVLLINEYTEEDGLEFRDASHLIDFPAPPDPACVPPDRPQAEHTYVDPADMAHGAADDPHAVDTAGLAGGIDPCNPPYPYRGHAVTFTDFDKDGDNDLPMIKGGTEIIAPFLWSGEPNRFFRNNGGNALNWLFVELHGTVSNAQGVGARVEVVARTANGSRRIFEDARAGRCFSASGPEELHFGLGDSNLIETLRVSWPSGVSTVLYDVQINQRLSIEETVLAASDFDDWASLGWEPSSGSWSVLEGAYVQSDPGPRSGLTVFSAALSDYTVVGKVSYLSGSATMGIAGRVSADGSAYYAVLLNGNSARLYRVQDETLFPLGAAVPIEPASPGKSYVVGLQFSDALIGMILDGRAMPPVTDEALASGGVGLVTNATIAAFDNIAVYQRP